MHAHEQVAGLEHDLEAAIRRAGLVRADEALAVSSLAGGVSSDITLVEAGARAFCVKRALPKLKVAADWRAPVERNHSEAEWLRAVAAILPDSVPQLLAEDRAAGWFAMQWLPPLAYPVWKEQLRDGIVVAAFAASVGDSLARIHAATAHRDDIAARFANDHIFYPIRLEAYLVATAAKHEDCAARLLELVAATVRTKTALVHGDVSPKNILAGPRGPVFLDAECACYGEPAFDLAFCLNHLLLKCSWRPQWRVRYLACFAALKDAYLARVSWEPAAALERRAAHLLPGLLLGRIDGKSPVEYIDRDEERERVRGVARALLLDPVDRLDALERAWQCAWR